ncbi:hypothetical protein ABZP36_016126 [Zizania latifolia]
MAAIRRADVYFRINEKLSSFGSLQYSKIMDIAFDKAIKEIIGPVIQRSVTLASRTTKELMDYAMEADDSATSRFAHLMVGTLARSLAHVTSKIIHILIRQYGSWMCPNRDSWPHARLLM